MKSQFLLLIISLVLAVSCASTSRDPAAVKKQVDENHQQYEHGVFDQPNR